MATDKHPAQTQEGTVRPRSLDLYEQFHATMLERAQQNSASSEERNQRIMADQMERIFTATSKEERFKADMGGTIQARDAHGLKVRILDYRPDISTKEFANSHGWYGTMNATVLGGPMHIMRQHDLKIGDPIVLQTGADLFLAKVAAMEANNELPADGYISAIKTSSGNDVIKFWESQEAMVAATTEGDQIS